MGSLIYTMAYIEYGVLIAFVISALLLVLIAFMNSNKKLNALSYIFALVLVVLLTFQMSRLVGACCINDAVKDVRNVVGMFSKTAANLISYSTKDVRWFIFRRVMWSVIFCAIAGVGINFTMEKGKTKSRKVPRGAKISRRYTSVSGRRSR